MLKYIGKRLLWMIPVIIGVAVLIFSLMYFVPGDPAKIILGSEATDLQLAAKREQLGLDQPFLIQLGSYLYHVFFRFDFGESYIYGTSVAGELMQRVPRTAIIGVGTILVTCIGIPLGVAAAINAGKWQDTMAMIIALAGVAMPDFWLGMLLVLLFALKLGWLPATGIGGPQYYVLPILCEGFGGVANLARQTRSSMLEVIRSDFITTAKSKGLSGRKVIWNHAVPNALMPVVTIVGNRFAHCLGGAVILETLFSIPGVGLYVVTAVNNRDYPVVQGCVIILAIISAIGILLTDLCYAFIDPRIKAQYEGRGNH